MKTFIKFSIVNIGLINPLLTNIQKSAHRKTKRQIFPFFCSLKLIIELAIGLYKAMFSL